MASLFNLSQEYMEVADMLSDPEYDEESVKAMLEVIKADIEVKADGYAKLVRYLESMLKALETELSFFNKKKDTLKNNIKRLKDAIRDALILTGHDGKDGLAAGSYKLKVEGNGGKRPLVITGEVPQEFTRVTVEVDTERVRNFLESLDENDACEWAHFEDRGKHLAIR